MKCGHDSLSAINNPECPECATYEDLRIGPPDPCPACGTPWVEHDGPTMLCRTLQESRRAEREAIEALAKYKARLAEVEAERDMWKANHDEMVARNRLLRNRPDLPLERVQGYDAVVERIERVEAENANVNGAYAIVCAQLREAEGRCSQLEHENAAFHKLHSDCVDERDALRGALEAVEWCNGKKMSSKDHYITKCPWCLRVRKDGHAPDCARQRALGIAP